MTNLPSLFTAMLASIACNCFPGDKPEVPAWLSGGGTSIRADDPALIRGGGNVRWRAFAAETFAESSRQSKPILVFLTADWIVRGKQMERVTFSDITVATRLSEEFVPVRINRDERPDQDSRLQQAARALGAGGTLPLIVVMTPDGRPFYAAGFCYADDDPVNERPGLSTILRKLSQSWKAQREEIEKRAAELDAALQKANETEDARAPLEKINTDALVASAKKLAAIQSLGAIQQQSSGQFPAPRAIELGLAHHARSGDKQSLELAAGALGAMLRGGVYDQLDGGFYRSSRDPLWIVPHFEKLLSVNAELSVACLHAWQKSSDERLKRAVEQTLNFWMGMRDPSGTFFYGSQAGGTSDVDDGVFATWSVKDIERALRDETDCKLTKLVFDIQESGEFPASMPDRNVLFDALNVGEAAKRLNLPAEDAEKRLQRIRDVLRLTRAARKSPAIDKNIYIDANALMAAALIECGAVMKNAEWTEQGLKTLRGLLKRPESSLLARGTSRLQQDEAATLYASAIAFAFTTEKSFLADAEAILKRLDENFWDAKNGGYFDHAANWKADSPGLAWRTKLYQDAIDPSPNGLVALACLKMAAATGRPEFKLKAQSIVEAFGGALEQLGPYGATLGAAAYALKNEQKK